MSATKFRVGDVVRMRHGYYRAGEVLEITSVHDDPPGQQVIQLERWGSYRPHALELLRRPVHDGDRLRDRNGVVATARIYVRTVVFEYEGECPRLDEYPRGWTHADGTPIEPPAAEPCITPVEHVDREELLRRFPKGETHADCVDARSFIALRAQLAAQADMLQPKDDEIRRLKAELLDATREVEQFRRKVRR